MPVPPPEVPVPPLELPVRLLDQISFLQTVFDFGPVKALLALPILAAPAIPIAYVFRSWWREFDAEAAAHRAELAARNEMDYRPAVCFTIVAAVLTMQEYYGDRRFYNDVLREPLQAWAEGGKHPFVFGKYDELFGYAWWVLARVIGYVVIPLPLWKLIFPKDKLWEMGLQGGGFFKHLWMYGACTALVLPFVGFAALQPDFASYYPFYKQSSRSWFDFLAWEAMYFVQFFSLELFFRGWMVMALRRTLGSAAIFAMALPYCMIHYGKPYFEAHVAVIAGVVLGSLSMRMRSIYGGFLVHVLIALGMDFFSLWRRGALPVTFWSPN
jgi:hypothetical protein